MEDQQVYRKVHDGVYREEPTFIRALQGHSGKNLVFLMHHHNKRWSKATHHCCTIVVLQDTMILQENLCHDFLG